MRRGDIYRFGSPHRGSFSGPWGRSRSRCGARCEAGSRLPLDVEPIERTPGALDALLAHLAQQIDKFAVRLRTTAKLGLALRDTLVHHDETLAQLPQSQVCCIGLGVDRLALGLQLGAILLQRDDALLVPRRFRLETADLAVGAAPFGQQRSLVAQLQLQQPHGGRARTALKHLLFEFPERPLTPGDPACDTTPATSRAGVDRGAEPRRSCRVAIGMRRLLHHRFGTRFAAASSLVRHRFNLRTETSLEPGRPVETCGRNASLTRMVEPNVRENRISRGRLEVTADRVTNPENPETVKRPVRARADPAVRHGAARPRGPYARGSGTGRAAAALILMLAFLVLSARPGFEVKECTIGLAAGLIRDGTLIRALLEPALMVLLGGANWWIPGWTRSALLIGDRERAPEAATENV